VDQRSFEEALAELESIVSRMDSGQVKLADSVALYERGVALRNRLESMLSDARMRVEKIQLSPGASEPAVVPLDVE
jgi:exodeoxyribonuclease VII small subunit